MEDLDLDMNLDNDDEDLFGDDDLFGDMEDPFAPPPKLEGREAVIFKLKDAGNGFLDSFKVTPNDISNLTSAVDDFMPDSIKADIQPIKDISDTFTDVLEKTKSEVKVEARKAFQIAEKLLPEDSKLRNVTDKVKNFFGLDEDEYNSKTETEEERRDREISESVVNALGELQQREDYQNYLRDTIEDFNRKKDRELLVRQSVYLSELNKFNQNVANRYYRESLKLQYQQVYFSSKLLDIQKTGFDTFKNLLTGIAKNTALPDIIKQTNSEVLEHKLKQGLFSNISDTLFSKNDWVKNVKETISDKAEAIISGIASGVSMADSMAGMSDMMGGDEMAALGMTKENQIGGIAGDSIRGIVANKLGSLFEKTSIGKKTLGTIKSFMLNPSEALEDLAGDDVTSQRHKFFSSLADLTRADDTENIVSTIKQEDLSAPKTFDTKVYKSITQVIPEILTKIYGEVNALRTKKEKPEEIQYDFHADKFVKKEKIKNEVHKDIRNEVIKSGVIDSINRIIDDLSERTDIKIKPEEKIDIGKGLLSYLLTNKSINPRKFKSTDFYSFFDKKVSKKAKEIFDTYLNTGDELEKAKKQEELYRALDYAKQRVPNIVSQLDSAIKSNKKEQLEELGFLEYDEEAKQYKVKNDKFKETIVESYNEANNEELLSKLKIEDPEEKKKQKIKNELAKQTALKINKIKKSVSEKIDKVKDSEIVKDTINNTKDIYNTSKDNFLEFKDKAVKEIKTILDSETSKVINKKTNEVINSLSNTDKKKVKNKIKNIKNSILKSEKVLKLKQQVEDELSKVTDKNEISIIKKKIIKKYKESIKNIIESETKKEIDNLLTNTKDNINTLVNKEDSKDNKKSTDIISTTKSKITDVVDKYKNIFTDQFGINFNLDNIKKEIQNKKIKDNIKTNDLKGKVDNIKSVVTDKVNTGIVKTKETLDKSTKTVKGNLLTSNVNNNTSKQTKITNSLSNSNVNTGKSVVPIKNIKTENTNNTKDKKVTKTNKIMTKLKSVGKLLSIIGSSGPKDDTEETQQMIEKVDKELPEDKKNPMLTTIAALLNKISGNIVQGFSSNEETMKEVLDPDKDESFLSKMTKGVFKYVKDTVTTTGKMTWGIGKTLGKFSGRLAMSASNKLLGTNFEHEGAFKGLKDDTVAGFKNYGGQLLTNAKRDAKWLLGLGKKVGIGAAKKLTVDPITGIANASTKIADKLNPNKDDKNTTENEQTKQKDKKESIVKKTGKKILFTTGENIKRDINFIAKKLGLKKDKYEEIEKNENTAIEGNTEIVDKESKKEKQNIFDKAKTKVKNIKDKIKDNIRPKNRKVIKAKEINLLNKDKSESSKPIKRIEDKFKDFKKDLLDKIETISIKEMYLEDKVKKKVKDSKLGKAGSKLIEGVKDKTETAFLKAMYEYDKFKTTKLGKSIDEKKEKINEKLLEVLEKLKSNQEPKKKKNYFDRDGDGDRDGNWKDRLKDVNSKAKELGSKLKGVVGKVGEKVKKDGWLFTLLTGAVAILGKMFKGIFSIGKGISAVVGSLGSIAKGIFSLPGKIASGISSLWSGAKNIVGKGIDLAKSAGSKIAGLWDGAKGLVSRGLNFFKKGGIKKALIGAGAAGAGLLGYNLLGDKTENIAEKANKIKDGVIEGAGVAATAIKNSKTVDTATKLVNRADDVADVAGYVDTAHSLVKNKETIAKVAEKTGVKKIGKKVKVSAVKAFLNKLKTFIVKKLGPKAGSKLMGKIASRFVPMLGTALLAYDAFKIGWYMLHDKLSFKSAVSKQILGFDIFNDNEPAVDENGEPIKPDIPEDQVEKEKEKLEKDVKDKEDKRQGKIDEVKKEDKITKPIKDKQDIVKDKANKVVNKETKPKKKKPVSNKWSIKQLALGALKKANGDILQYAVERRYLELLHNKGMTEEEAKKEMARWGRGGIDAIQGYIDANNLNKEMAIAEIYVKRKQEAEKRKQEAVKTKENVQKDIVANKPDKPVHKHTETVKKDPVAEKSLKHVAETNKGINKVATNTVKMVTTQEKTLNVLEKIEKHLRGNKLPVKNENSNNTDTNENTQPSTNNKTNNVRQRHISKPLTPAVSMTRASY